MSTNLTQFIISQCNLDGCSHHRNTYGIGVGDCWFNNRYISQWIDFVEEFDPSPRCQLAQQIRVYKTREFINNK